MASILKLPFMKGAQAVPGQAASPPPAQPQQAILETKLKLYRLIIERYRNMIEQGETKTITDIKALVIPHDPKVVELRNSITESFRPYIFEEHFLQAAKMCFSYVSAFQTVSPPVSFWLSFSEMEELLAGDEIDKSILLCSLIRSLGSENARVFVTDSRNSYVAFEVGGKSHLADHGKPELAASESTPATISLMKGKPLYSFSDKDYEDYQE